MKYIHIDLWIFCNLLDLKDRRMQRKSGPCIVPGLRRREGISGDWPEEAMLPSLRRGRAANVSQIFEFLLFSIMSGMNGPNWHGNRLYLNLKIAQWLLIELYCLLGKWIFAMYLYFIVSLGSVFSWFARWNRSFFNLQIYYIIIEFNIKFAKKTIINCL